MLYDFISGQNITILDPSFYRFDGVCGGRAYFSNNGVDLAFNAWQAYAAGLITREQYEGKSLATYAMERERTEGDADGDSTDKVD